MSRKSQAEKITPQVPSVAEVWVANEGEGSWLFLATLLRSLAYLTELSVEVTKSVGLEIKQLEKVQLLGLVRRALEGWILKPILEKLPEPLSIQVVPEEQKKVAVGVDLILSAPSQSQVLIEARYTNGKPVRSLDGTVFRMGSNSQTVPKWITTSGTTARLAFPSRSQQPNIRVVAHLKIDSLPIFSREIAISLSRE